MGSNPAHGPRERARAGKAVSLTLWPVDVFTLTANKHEREREELTFNIYLKVTCGNRKKNKDSYWLRAHE